MSDPVLELELERLSAKELRRRIKDMDELLEDSSWSLMAKLGAAQYRPMLLTELQSRGEPL